MPYYVSPHFRDDHFDSRYPDKLAFEEKVHIFADSVRGWQLDIAELTARASGHAGFAVLSILVNYFEMIAKYQDGFVGQSKSWYYFSKGLSSVFPTLSANQKVRHKFYTSIRCSLYHEAGTGPGIELDASDPKKVMRATPDGKGISVNPFNLSGPLHDHFSRYIVELLDPSNKQLRDNFEKRFDDARKQ